MAPASLKATAHGSWSAALRADEKVPGHGLGLAMVRETVDLYGGRLAIEKSTLGGARILLSLRDVKEIPRRPGSLPRLPRLCSMRPYAISP